MSQHKSLIQELKNQFIMTKEELKHLLVKTEEYTQEQVDDMSGYELLDAMLKWEGICGYTRQILRWVKAAYESDNIL